MCECVNQAATKRNRTSTQCDANAKYTYQGRPVCGKHNPCSTFYTGAAAVASATGGPAAAKPTTIKPLRPLLPAKATAAVAAAEPVTDAPTALQHLPPELWLDLMTGATFDEWIKYRQISRETRALASRPGIMRSIKLIAKHELVLYKPGRAVGPWEDRRALKILPLLTELALAGNFAARVRILSSYTYWRDHARDPFPYPDLPFHEWLQDPELVPYLMWCFSTPHRWPEPKLHAFLPATSKAIFNRNVPFPRTAPFVPIISKNPPVDDYVVISWIYELCEDYQMVKVFALARHLYLWYTKLRDIPRNQKQLCACAAMWLTWRTVGPPADRPNMDLNDGKLSFMTEYTYTSEHILHFTNVMNSCLPPIAANIPSLTDQSAGYDGTIVVNPKTYLYPLFAGTFWNVQVIKVLQELQFISEQIIRLNQEFAQLATQLPEQGMRRERDRLKSLMLLYLKHRQYLHENLPPIPVGILADRRLRFLQLIKQDETELFNIVDAIIRPFKAELAAERGSMLEID